MLYYLLCLYHHRAREDRNDSDVVAVRGRMTDSAGSAIILYSIRLYRHFITSSLRQYVRENSERNSTSYHR